GLGAQEPEGVRGVPLDEERVRRRLGPAAAVGQRLERIGLPEGVAERQAGAARTDEEEAVGHQATSEIRTPWRLSWPSSRSGMRAVTSICSCQSPNEASTTCRRRSASRASSSVERKDATRWWGSLRMKPTVSVTSALYPSPRSTVRVAESSVAKSRSSTNRSASPDS